MTLLKVLWNTLTKTVKSHWLDVDFKIFSSAESCVWPFLPMKYSEVEVNWLHGIIQSWIKKSYISSAFELLFRSNFF